MIGQLVQCDAINGQYIVSVEKVLSSFHIVQGSVGRVPGRMPSGTLSDSGSSVSGSGKDWGVTGIGVVSDGGRIRAPF